MQAVSVVIGAGAGAVSRPGTKIGQQGYHEINASSSPILRPVPDIQDFNNLVGVTVHDNIRRDDKLASAFDLSRSAHSGKRRELVNAVDNRLSESSGRVGIILLNVLSYLAAVSNWSAASVVHRISLMVRTAG